MPEICARFVDCHVWRRPREREPDASGKQEVGIPRTGASSEAKTARGETPGGAAPGLREPEEWLTMLRAPHILLGGTWQMVSGTLEPGETAYAAAARELLEETGLRPLHFYQASYVNRFYLAATDQILLSPVFAAEVAPDAQVRLSGEHTDFAWVTAEEAHRRLPWPGQRESLATIRDQFLLREPRPESRLDHLVQLHGAK